MVFCFSFCHFSSVIGVGLGSHDGLVNAFKNIATLGLISDTMNFLKVCLGRCEAERVFLVLFFWCFFLFLRVRDLGDLEDFRDFDREWEERSLFCFITSKPTRIIPENGSA